MHWLVCLTLAFSLGGVSGLPLMAQSDEAVDTIERLIEALGGRMSLESIESLEIEIEYAGGTKGRGTAKYLGGMSRRDVELEAGVHYSYGFDGANWWKDGKVDNSDSARATYESAYYFPPQALRWLKDADQFEIVPKSEYDDSEFAHCTCLKRVFGAIEVHRYFDPESDLLVGAQRFKVQGGERTFQFKCKFEYGEREGMQIVVKDERSNRSDWRCHATYSGLKVDPPLQEGLFKVETDDD